MINGNAIKIDGENILDINKIIQIDTDRVIQFGKNKFKKIKHKR